MPAILFDTLKMARTLQAGGFTDQQAETMTKALGDAASIADVATRSDLMDLGIGLKHDIDALKAEMKADIAALEQRMTIRLGGMMVVMTGVLGGLHFFH